MLKQTLKCIAFIVLILSNFDAIAQRHLIGISGGRNGSSYRADYLSPAPKSLGGVVFGLSYEFHFHPKFYVGIEALYNQLGFKPALTTLESKSPNTVTVNTAGTYGKVRTNLFSLPVKVGYTFGNTTYGFIAVGALPSYELKSTMVFPAGVIGSKEFEVKTITTENDFILGSMIEVGMGYKFNPRLKIYASLGCQYFSQYVEKTPNTIKPFRYHLYASMITGGLQYTLDKKAE